METESNIQRNTSIIVSIGLCIVAAAYILILLKIILFKSGFTTELRELSLQPFSFITDSSWKKATIEVVLKNVLGNFALFIPMGVLIPSIFKNVSKMKTVLICFTVSFLFEGTQYIVGFGISDIDDLIMNTFGGIIGALLYFVFLKKVDKIANAKIATLAFLSVFGICGLLFLYLYQPNMLPAQIKLILAYLR